MRSLPSLRSLVLLKCRITLQRGLKEAPPILSLKYPWGHSLTGLEQEYSLQLERSHEKDVKIAQFIKGRS